MSNDGPEGSHKGALASSTVDGVSVNSSLEARELTQSGQCSTCKALDAKESTVCCFFCSKTFHALCYDILEEKTVQRKPRSDNSCTKTFYTNYCSNVKDKNQGTKFGSFVFICDPCRTKNETQAARNTNDHVRVLDNRVSALSSDISDLKELLNKALRPPVTDSVDNGQMTSNQESPSQTSNINVWCDKERVQSLLVVQKEANIESTQLEKTVINHGIQVQKRYVDKKGDTVLVLPSKQARDKLKCELQSSGVSNDQLREPKQRYPTISMVGLPKTADINDKKSIQNTLLSQNPTLARCLNASSSALFDIISVKPLRMNENVKQAIIRVSDDVRYAISQSQNRLYYGMDSCRVYDQLYIKRCNRCQGFGHYARDCSKEVCCGICGITGHETHHCPHANSKDISTKYHCANCYKAGDLDCNHPAYSSACPSYRVQQEKLRASLSYYSKNMLR
ncbi:hypothetical protein ACHWQZ_G000246 [Mnemiopsis leidyi]